MYIKSDLQYKQARYKHTLKLKNLLEEARLPLPNHFDNFENRGVNRANPRGGSPNQKKKRRFIKHSRYIRKKRKNASKKLDKLFINLSDFPLSEAMQRVLNRHLSFSVMAKHFNTTQLDVDFRRFDRTMKWIEIFVDDNSQIPDSIFKQQKKHNLLFC